MSTIVTETKAWRALQAHHAEVKDVHLRDLFAKDPGRAERFAALTAAEVQQKGSCRCESE
jgi:glucose-6-phosphate isomerase